MDEDAAQSLISRTPLLAGLVGGLIHAGVAVLLWHYFGLDDLGELLMIKPLIGMYIFLGMFALGFVPTLLYVDQKLVLPALVVAVLLLLSAVGSWLTGPVRAPVGGPTPFGLYILFWVGVAALAGLTGGFEYKRKQRATG